MLTHRECCRQCRAAIGRQGDGEIRVVVSHSGQKLVHLDIKGHLLKEFTVQGLLGGFTLLDLAARELPTVAGVAVACRAPGEELTVSLILGCQVLALSNGN